MPASAIAPWQGPGNSLTDPRLRAAAVAMLAPSPHNIQPWMIRLVGDDSLTLHVDLSRLLPETDPPGRQILIGQGTFLELFRLAAASEGWRAELVLLPEGPFPDDRLDERPVAAVRMMRDESLRPDPLFAYHRNRRSNKEPFDTERPVSDVDLTSIAANADNGMRFVTTQDPAQRQTLRDLAEKALILEVETPRTMQESIDLMRIGPSEVAANPDGIDLLGPMIWWGSKLGMVSKEDIQTPGTQSYQVGIDMVKGQTQTAMAFGWLVTPDNSRLSQLTAGMTYLHLNLAATRAGVAMHPMSQLLQEYPEMTEMQQTLLAELDVAAPAHVQMLVRFGHGVNPGPSPRRQVRDIVRG
ncbi:MAG: nitroreductase family protein [Minwuia sp.]|nr:nitroreductase family protein [Minwuia sp.]